MKLFEQDDQKKVLAGLKTLVQGNTQFALDLYRVLQGTEGNLFYSPYSISAALAITCAGARADTQVQISQALHFLPDQDQLHPAFALLEAKIRETDRQGHVQLNTASTLWPRKGYKFLKAYLALAKKTYGVRITPLDFGDGEAARRTINTWVEKRTDDRIKDLIPAGVLDRLTRLVLVNAIYFKGAWACQFDPRLTAEAPFLVDPDRQVMVPMMTQKHAFRYAETADLQVLKLPYAGHDLSMLVLLPTRTGGLQELERSLSAGNLDKWIGDLAETEVELFLPRFKLDFPFQLDDSLRSLGMLDAFSPRADFSGMDGTKELFIGAALHKAFVAVDEQGTEAAAATAVVMQMKALSFPSVVFRADHPFIFLIRENGTGSILFIGRLANPL